VPGGERTLPDVDFFAVNNFGDTRSGGLAGPMGLFVIVLMSIATVLLIRNMNKRLRRLPDSFPDQESAQEKAVIAQLDADLDRPAAEPGRRNAGPDRSPTAAGPTDTEVSGDESVRPPEPGDSAAGRS
jgi:hypothetical protein